MSVKTVLLSAVIAVQPLGAIGAETCYDDAMIEFDGSDSMAYDGFNTLNVPRINDARQAVRDTVPGIAERRNLGLIIYGPGHGARCGNVDLRFGPMPNASPRIIADVDNIVPGGMTALTEAVEAAADALSYTSQTATVVLVTDGQETCGGSPCEMAQRMQQAAQDLTIHVIGFKLRPEIPTFKVPNQVFPSDTTPDAKCLADATGGKYVTAETADELATALRDTLGCKVYGRHPWTKLAARF